METDRVIPQPWTLSSTIDEMVNEMQQAVFVARLTHQRSIDEVRPVAAKEISLRAWRVRADVLQLLLIMREVDPETVPESFSAFANAVSEQMAFLRKTMREYKALSRAKAEIETQYKELSARYNAAVDSIDDARRTMIMIAGVQA